MGYVYDKASLLQYIRRELQRHPGRGVQCPVAGVPSSAVLGCGPAAHHAIINNVHIYIYNNTMQLPPHACAADLASALGMPGAQDIKAEGWQMNAPMLVRQALFPPFWALPAGYGGAGC